MTKLKQRQPPGWSAGNLPSHPSRLISDLSESGHPAGRKAPTGFRPHLAHLISIENLSIRLPYLVIRLRLQTDNPTVNYSLHQLYPMIHRIIPPSLETQQTQRRTVKLVFGTGCPDHQCRHVMPLPGTSKTTFQGKNSPSNFYVSTKSFAVSPAHSCHSIATTYQLCIKI